MGALDGISPRPIEAAVDSGEALRGRPVSLKHIAKQAVREMESSVILQVLRENKWNRRKAAHALNISYRALIYKIQEAGLAQRHHRKNSRRQSTQHNPHHCRIRGTPVPNWDTSLVGAFLHLTRRGISAFAGRTDL